MSRKSNKKLRLVAQSGATPAQLESRRNAAVIAEPGLIKASASLPDEAEGLQIARNVGEQTFMIDHGSKLEPLHSELEWIEKQRSSLRSMFDAIADQLADTPEFVPAAYDCTSNPNRRNAVPFSRWQMRHQINAFFSLIALLAVLLTSWFSVQAVLLDAGLPIFINQPMLAWAMATIAPGASVAIKSMISIFESVSAKKRFRIVIYALTAISLTGWVMLLASETDGLGGEVDLFAEPDHLTTWAFTVLQLSTEVLAGAALFLNLEAIAAIYAPDSFVKNPAFTRLSDRRDQIIREIETLNAGEADLKGRLAELTSQRDLQISAAELAYRQARIRFDGGLI